MITSTTVADMNHHNINNNDRESLCACILIQQKVFSPSVVGLVLLKCAVL